MKTHTEEDGKEESNSHWGTKKKKRGSLQSLQSLQDRSNLLPKPLTMVSVGKRPNNT